MPLEVLTKPGKLSDEEFAYMKAHPVEGAKILSQRGGGNALASTVAYEHHIWFNGQGGYPSVNFRRDAHYASRIVHVCDIYDALCSKRPYRDAWSQERALNLLRGLQGTELDPAIYPGVRADGAARGLDTRGVRPAADGRGVRGADRGDGGHGHRHRRPPRTCRCRFRGLEPASPAAE